MRCRAVFELFNEAGNRSRRTKRRHRPRRRPPSDLSLHGGTVRAASDGRRPRQRVHGSPPQGFVRLDPFVASWRRDERAGTARHDPGRRARRLNHQPDKVLFPARGAHEARSRALLHRGGRRRTPRRRRPAEHAQALPERRSARSSSIRSAHPSRGRTGSRSVTLKFPSGRSADEVVPRDAASLLWMANLACLELHPHPVRADDLDHPDELRVDLDPVPGVKWSQVRDVARVVHATLDDYGLTGWPKTSGSRGVHVVVRIQHRSGRSSTCVARRSRWHAKSNVARPNRRRASGGRKNATASSSTTTRTPRIVRSPAPIRYGPCRTLVCPRRSLGTSSTTAILQTSRWRRCPPGSSPLAIDMTDIDRARRLARRAARAVGSGMKKEGLGDAPWPPHYKKQKGEPTRVQPSKARYRFAAPNTSLELERRRDLELVVAAVVRRPVGPPPQECCRVSEAIALQVVVFHFARRARSAAAPTTYPCPALHRLWPPGMRDPSPSASAHARHGCFSNACLRSGCKFIHQRLPRRHGERRRDADVMQHAVVVVQTRGAASRWHRGRSCASENRRRRSRRFARV